MLSCKGRIVNKEEGLYCPCIEAQLPKPARRRRETSWGAGIENAEEPFTPAHGLEGKLLMKKMRAYGLSLFEIKLVYYRAIQGWSFTKIAAKQGWINLERASHHYRAALKKLRSGGFKIK